MKIIFNDENIIVLVKEVGLDSEKDIPELLKKEFEHTFYCIHRLDKNVAGLMVYAKNKEYAKYLSQLIEKKKMLKEYIAWVNGIIKDEDIFEDYLFKDSRQNKVFVIKKERKGAKLARLSYKCLKIQDNNSLVLIKLDTGRSHQIRVQFASRKHPLLGDHKYGAKDKNKYPLLFSYHLAFKYKDKDLDFKLLPEWAKV